MPKLGMHPFKHTEQSAKRFAVGLQLLDLAAAPPMNGTPWGSMVERITGDTTWGGMLGNDNYGDCVPCDDLRNSVAWCALSTGKILKPTQADALKLYYAINGNEDDNGTDPIVNANFMENTGWTDASGVVHKIDAWVSVDPTNDNHMKNALNLFGVLKLCIDFPDFAMKQFDAGKPWDYTGQSYTIESGHDIMASQYERETWADGVHDTKSIISWGRRFSGTHRFWRQFLTGVIAPISKDFIMANGLFPSRINLDQAIADLKAIAA